MFRLFFILVLIASSPWSLSAQIDTPITADTDTSDVTRQTRPAETIAKIPFSDYSFASLQEQSDSLLSYMQQAVSSTSTQRLIWDQKFFHAFPDSFDEMRSVFGYDSEHGAAPLYERGNAVIKYFSQLESIPESTYYEKYIRININGVWEADNIDYAFYFADHLLIDSENAVESLSKFSNGEIQSVFRFIFDGPHPRNRHNEFLYEKLKTILDDHSSRLSELLTQSYLKLMQEDDRH